jgi:hypothetical protein
VENKSSGSKSERLACDTDAPARGNALFVGLTIKLAGFIGHAEKVELPYSGALDSFCHCAAQFSNVCVCDSRAAKFIALLPIMESCGLHRAPNPFFIARAPFRCINL